jgi:hypothetical protein
VTLLADALASLEEAVEGSGCEHAKITVRRSPDAPRCQYVRGACVSACMGGKTGYLSTNDPVETTTGATSLFSATLASPQHVTAAVVIANALAGFLCLARPLAACRKEDYAPCIERLRDEIGGAPVFLVGKVPVAEEAFSRQRVETPGDAEVFVVSADGLLSETGRALLDQAMGTTRIILLGPSTVAVANLAGQEHWCPFGR